MSAHAMILYEHTPLAKFNMEYYLNKHMPLVMKQWSQAGLKSYQVVKFEKGLPDPTPAFTVGAYLNWESVEAIDAAMASEAAKPVFADVPNFTDIQPSFTIGHHVGSG